MSPAMSENGKGVGPEDLRWFARLKWMVISLAFGILGFGALFLYGGITLYLAGAPSGEPVSIVREKRRIAKAEEEMAEIEDLSLESEISRAKNRIRGEQERRKLRRMWPLALLRTAVGAGLVALFFYMAAKLGSKPKMPPTEAVPNGGGK